MTITEKNKLRLQFLARVITKEVKHLIQTDERLFLYSFTLEQATQLEHNPQLAEQVEAFVSRFGRLQDTLGDKLLPELLTALGEKTSAVIDNLDKAERLNFIASAEEWMTMRFLRNQMVHEYIEDPAILNSAILSAHQFVPKLISSANAMINEIEQRGWI